MNVRQPKKYVAFFDFDNTITKIDIIDDMLLRFSKDDKWKALEEKWVCGQIGSRECLDGQIRGIRITKKRLDKYLLTIKLDPYFKRLKKFLDSRSIKTIILSDDFDYILKRILRNSGISNIKIYSNKLRIAGDRLMPEFPFTDKDCPRCGHCKEKNIKMLANVDKAPSVIYYIGDGLSDVCPAKYADMVFAKGYLLKYLKKERLSYIPFKGLKDVYKYFKRSLS